MSSFAVVIFWTQIYNPVVVNKRNICEEFNHIGNIDDELGFEVYSDTNTYIPDNAGYSKLSYKSDSIDNDIFTVIRRSKPGAKSDRNVMKFWSVETSAYAALQTYWPVYYIRYVSWMKPLIGLSKRKRTILNEISNVIKEDGINFIETG